MSLKRRPTFSGSGLLVGTYGVGHGVDGQRFRVKLSRATP